MKRTMRWAQACLVFCLSVGVSGVQAQQSAAPQEKSQGQAQQSIAADPELPRGGPDAEPGQNVAVPRLIKFSSTAKDQLGHVPTGVVGVTFAIYKEQEGGAALWMETQNAQVDEQGRYAVLLGATKNEGLPVELFAAAEPRWLGVQVNLPGEVEQPRVLLVSVPYALKAADAENLGGRPASSYALATGGIGTGPDSGGGGGSAGTKAGSGKSGKAAATAAAVTANFIPMFTDSSGTLGNSVMIQSGGNIGLGTSPVITFDVNGGIRASTGLATGGRNVSPDAINTNALFLNGSNAMAVSGTNVAFAPGALFTKTSFYSGGVERMTIDGTTGNVGVGTTIPAFNLDVNGMGNFVATNNSQVLSVNQNGSGVAIFAATPSSVGTAIMGRANAPSGNASTAVAGINSATTGAAFGVIGDVSSPAGIAGVFDNHAAGLILSGQANGSQKFSVDGFGNVGLSGSLSLPATASATVGVISLGGVPFLHNFGNSNTFVGSGAGNMSMLGGRNTGAGFDSLLANNTGQANAAFGTYALAANTTGFQNSAFGDSALANNTVGGFNSAFGTNALQASNAAFNSAFGANALQADGAGNENAAFGFDALLNNTGGSQNSAFGNQALQANTVGGNNSAFGAFALNANTSGNNSACGGYALTANTTGQGNSAFGTYALVSNTTGNFNIAVGLGAGNNLSSAESNNIDIGNGGIGGESNTIRIGTGQTATYIAGISGATSGSGVPVLINSLGQLGTITSSRRFKHAIADIGAESDLLMKLRPVAFYYKPELDETQTRQYGLVAEEVAQVAPDLVVFDTDRQPQTVRYNFVNAMLLNEVQKQRRTIQQQQAEIEDLAARLAKFEALITSKP